MGDGRPCEPFVNARGVRGFCKFMVHIPSRRTGRRPTHVALGLTMADGAGGRGTRRGPARRRKGCIASFPPWPRFWLFCSCRSACCPTILRHKGVALVHYRVRMPDEFHTWRTGPSFLQHPERKKETPSCSAPHPSGATHGNGMKTGRPRQGYLPHLAPPPWPNRSPPSVVPPAH
jgi:hypothetical protein